MKVHIVSPKDNWILQKIGSKLMEITEAQMSGSQEINYEADLNYFVNWCYWKILYPKLDKPTKTLVFFTHFDDYSKQYLDVLDKADYIATMSLHGKEVLLSHGISYEKIHVIEGFGTLDDLPYRKIKIGISGRPYKTGRKGEDIILRLSKDLDMDIWEFCFDGNGWLDIISKCEVDAYPLNNFWDNIDYYFSPSHAEGGPMDMLNAAQCGIPIISRDVGFFHELKSGGDIEFEDYEDLSMQLKQIEENRIDKINKMKRHTWDNFKDWHIKLFKEINEK